MTDMDAGLMEIGCGADGEENRRHPSFTNTGVP
jgi:hypothetical protein